MECSLRGEARCHQEPLLPFETSAISAAEAFADHCGVNSILSLCVFETCCIEASSCPPGQVRGPQGLLSPRVLSHPFQGLAHH